MQRGDIKRIKNTQKKCSFEADNYLCVNLKCEDGTETGIMMTENEFKRCVSRYIKNKEDQPKVKSTKGFWRSLFSFN